jgi:hypothetical protein
MADYEPGQISARAAAKHFGKPGILRKTRVNRPSEEEFEGKQGKRDQGGRHDRGATEVAGSRSIDTKQKFGPKISKGGSAGKQHQPVKRAHIDDASLQQPEFAEGGNSPAVRTGQFRSAPPGGGKPSPGGAAAGRPSSKGARPMQRPGQQTGWYSAAGKRP